MPKKSLKSKPYNARNSIFWSVILFACLLTITVILKSTIGWPGEKSDTIVLVGIFIFSLLPVIFVILDATIKSGGVIEYGDFKIDFSHAGQTGSEGFTVPANIGVHGQQVNDSSSGQILDSLRKAMANDIIVLDLEDGTMWKNFSGIY